jgi:hypothetical protein
MGVEGVHRRAGKRTPIAGIRAGGCVLCSRFDADSLHEIRTAWPPFLHGAPERSMFAPPKRPEIDHRTIKLIVGLIATSLAGLTSFFAGGTITSISASYYEGGWAQSIFIGFLFAIAALLLAYNGLSQSEMVLSKCASVAGLGVALFPCRCVSHAELVPYVHAVSATAMFLILAWFCFGFFRRARDKGHAQAKARAGIYAACGLAIVASIVVLAFDGFTGGSLSAHIPRLTFYGEAVGLVSFGVSWLTASRVLPVLTRKDERFSPFSESNPD